MTIQQQIVESGSVITCPTCLGYGFRREGRCKRCGGAKVITNPSIPFAQPAAPLPESGQGHEATGLNPDYRPPVPRWNTIEIIAPEGYSFGIAMDRGLELSIVMKPPGGEWPGDYEVTGQNTILSGHRCYVVRSDGESHEPAPQSVDAEIGPLIGKVLRNARIAVGMGLREFAEHIEMRPSRFLEIQRTGEATYLEWLAISDKLKIQRENRHAENLL